MARVALPFLWEKRPTFLNEREKISRIVLYSPKSARSEVRSITFDYRVPRNAHEVSRTIDHDPNRSILGKSEQLVGVVNLRALGQLKGNRAVGSECDGVTI
jgi:hypothetical protein